VFLDKRFIPKKSGEYAVEIKFKKCIDTSVCVAFTSVGINETFEDLFLVYPNPSNEKITIESNHKGKIKTIILDINGKLIYENAFENEVTIDVSNLKPGIYLLQMTNDFGHQNNRKIIKL
jgi:FAD synthase